MTESFHINLKSFFDSVYDLQKKGELKEALKTEPFAAPHFRIFFDVTKELIASGNREYRYLRESQLSLRSI